MNKSSILFACEDNLIYMLEAKSLKLEKKFSLILSKELISIPGVEIKAREQTYFEKVSADYIYAPTSDSIFVGLNTGFICQYSLIDGKIQRIFNPLYFEYKIENPEKSISLSVENIILPGVQSMIYGTVQEKLFCNHKKMFSNSFNRTFTLEKTPIYSYDIKGVIHKKMEVDGTILGAKILENRNLYVCLTSEKSLVYVFDFMRNNLVLKFSCDFTKNVQRPMIVTALSVHEFNMNQRGQSADRVIQGGNISNEKIEGDILFFIEDNGSIIISQLSYENENGAIVWSPLNYLNSKSFEKDGKKDSIIGKTFSVLTYNAYKDKLLFADHEGHVHKFNDILKVVYAPRVKG
jgi:hypothetical protein